MRPEATPARGLSRVTALLVPALFFVVTFALLVSLGTWQMRRLAWKEALIERVETRVHADPVPLPPKRAWAALADPQGEYTRVRMVGTFRHADEVHVYTVISEPAGGAWSGQGWWVMTPLALERGGYVSVNRGFVPQEYKSPRARLGGQVGGEVSVTGLVRAPERGNAFTPDDNPATNIWFRRDPQAIAGAVGLPPDEVAPFFVDAEGAPPGGLPQGGETRLSFPNNHLQYALTWYGLALGLAGVFIALAWRRLGGG